MLPLHHPRPTILPVRQSILQHNHFCIAVFGALVGDAIRRVAASVGDLDLSIIEVSTCSAVLPQRSRLDVDESAPTARLQTVSYKPFHRVGSLVEQPSSQEHRTSIAPPDEETHYVQCSSPFRHSIIDERTLLAPDTATRIVRLRTSRPTSPTTSITARSGYPFGALALPNIPSSVTSISEESIRHHSVEEFSGTFTIPQRFTASATAARENWEPRILNGLSAPRALGLLQRVAGMSICCGTILGAIRHATLSGSAYRRVWSFGRISCLPGFAARRVGFGA